MTAEGALLHVLLALLNAGLALLVMRLPGSRLERGALAGLFATNAAVAASDPFATFPIYILLERVSVAFLIALPAAWLLRRNRPLSLVLGLAAAATLVAALLQSDTTLPIPFAIVSGLAVFGWEVARSRGDDREARYVLAAYLLAASTFLPLLTPSPGTPPPAAVRGFGLVATLGALALVLERTFRSGHAAGYLPALLALPVGGALIVIGYPSHGYLFLRPMLLGYGFLITGLPGGTLAHRPLVLATLGTAVVAAFLAPAVTTNALGGGILFAIGLGLLGLATVVALFARPLASALLAEPRDAPTRLELREGALALGRYRLVRELGAGGTARAWLADDERLRRRVVIKAAPYAPALVREARALAKLDHPHVVRVLDVGQEGETAVLVLEHVDGPTLASWARPSPPADVARLAAELLTALAHAHAAGIVHRDLKPANVLLDREGRARLADFGVASATDVAATGFSWEPPATAGTPRYMSPEQARGEDVDARSDLYSLGAVLYELLSGRPAAEATAENGYDLRVAIVRDPPRLPIEGIDPRWNDLLRRLLAKEKEKRCASAEEALIAARALGSR